MPFLSNAGWFGNTCGVGTVWNWANLGFNCAPLFNNQNWPTFSSCNYLSFPFAGNFKQDVFVRGANYTSSLFNFMPMSVPFMQNGLFGNRNSNPLKMKPFKPLETSYKVRSGEGQNVADGTSVTLSDVNYSIMGDSVANVKKLRPEMQRKVEKLFVYANNKGWKLTMNGKASCFRTQSQQNGLIANGAPAAKGNTSRHLRGCAVDVRIDGASRGPKLDELGIYATSIGMRWGGNFKNFTREPWHFDIAPASTEKGKEIVKTSHAPVADRKTEDTKSKTTATTQAYSDTPQREYQKVFDGTYTGDYVKMNGIIHFKYADAKLGGGLKSNAKVAFNKMAAAMKKDLGYTLSYTTAYRSRAQQLQSLKQNKSDPYTISNLPHRIKAVAPMGYTEHHTGYACDITIDGNRSRNNKDWLSDKKLKRAYEWLKVHAKEYGFEQSFGKNNAQGVMEEAWHWRYVGDADSKRTFYNARKFAGYKDLT